MVYLVYPALMILLFWGAGLCKKGIWNDSFMSIQQTKAMQGFAVIIVMFHHMSQRTCASWIPRMVQRPGLEPFINVGYLCVALFLFYSGFGLYMSFKTKAGYLDGFISRRVLYVVMTFYTSEIIYLIARILLKEKMTVPKILVYLIGLQQTNPNAWYSVVLPFLYLLFYFTFKKCKNERSAIWIIGVCIFIYMFACTFVNHNDFLICGEWWYNTIHLFLLGIIFAKYQEGIVSFIKKHYVPVLIFLIVMFLISVMLSGIAINVFSYYYGEYDIRPVPIIAAAWRRWICLAAQVLTDSSFVVLLYVLGLKIKIGNKALYYLGNMTMELYLIHGLFVHIFSYSTFDVAKSLYYIKNVLIYVIVVIALSIVVSILYKKLHAIIMKPIN